MQLNKKQLTFLEESADWMCRSPSDAMVQHWSEWVSSGVNEMPVDPAAGGQPPACAQYAIPLVWVLKELFELPASVVFFGMRRTRYATIRALQAKKLRFISSENAQRSLQQLLNLLTKVRVESAGAQA